MRMTARGGNRRRRAGEKSGAAGLALVAAVAVAITGCSSSSSKLADPLPSRTSVSPSSASVTPSPTSAADAALAQYRAFWAALTPASKAPASERRAMLAPYAADPELTSLLNGIARDRDSGRVYYGTPVLRPKITTLSTARRLAVINDCQDASRTGDKDLKSGRLLTKGTPATPVVSTLHLLNDGTWRVVFVSFPKQSCSAGS
jgi:hypothetical protein